MATIDIDAIGKQILAEAAKVPGDTWSKIKQASKLYINGYVQNLADIAESLAAGEIAADEAKIYAKNASYLLDMSIANTTQITLNEAQEFFDGVISVLKGAINRALPVAIL